MPLDEKRAIETRGKILYKWRDNKMKEAHTNNVQLELYEFKRTTSAVCLSFIQQMINILKIGALDRATIINAYSKN